MLLRGSQAMKFIDIIFLVITYVPRTSFIVYLSSTVGADLLPSPLLDEEDPDFPDLPPSAPFLPNNGMFNYNWLVLLKLET